MVNESDARAPVVVGEVKEAGHSPKYWRTGLSARLLLLTVLFVMLAEVLIFPPSVGRFLEDEVKDRIRDADFAIGILEELPTDVLSPQVDSILIDFTDARLIARSGDGSSKAVFLKPPKQTNMTINLNEDPLWTLIAHALRLLVAMPDDGIIRVIGPSPENPAHTLEMLFDSAPVRQELWGYGLNILQLSLLISVFTALLVYVVLQRNIVRPVRQLSQAMVEFARRPLSTFERLGFEERRDEVGEATEALATMRHTVRNSLVQNQRLASLGTGITQINHDLRNLLGTALLLSEQLEGSEDPKVRQKMPQITQSIEAAADLCQQTLSFAREGSVMLRKKTYSIQRLLNEIEIQLGLHFPQIDLEVTIPTTPESEVRSMSVDIVQLDRVLVNLVSNAIQAGAVTVWIDAQQSLLGDWQLCVADDGPGLSARAVEALFEPFSSSTKQSGTGLGLYNAREILRAHGGDLTLIDPGPATAGSVTSFSLRFDDDQLLGSRHG